MSTKKCARESSTVYVCTYEEHEKGESSSFDVFAVCDSEEAAEAACREKAVSSHWKHACMDGASAPYDSRIDEVSHDNERVIIKYCSQEVKSRVDYPASEDEQELAKCFCIYCSDEHPANEEGGVVATDYGEEYDEWGWDVDTSDPTRGCCDVCGEKLEKLDAAQTWHEYDGAADGSYFLKT